MEKSTLAFHGNASLQAGILEQVEAHTKADAFIRGEYYLRNGKGLDGFRGCFIGCAVHSYELSQGAQVESSYNSPEDVEAAFNFDPRLTRIFEGVFENCSEEYSKTFLSRVANAAAIGAAKGVNVRLVHWVFLHRIVKQVLADFGTPEVRKGCSKALAVLRDSKQGVNVTSARARAATNAANAVNAALEAARAAYTARAADYTARAAANAANATNAANAADYTASLSYNAVFHAACAADEDAEAARAAAFEKYGDWLIEILAGETA